MDLDSFEEENSTLSSLLLDGSVTRLRPISSVTQDDFVANLACSSVTTDFLKMKIERLKNENKMLLEKLKQLASSDEKNKAK